MFALEMGLSDQISSKPEQEGLEFIPRCDLIALPYQSDVRDEDRRC